MIPEQIKLIDRTLGIVGQLSVIGAAVFVMLAIHLIKVIALHLQVMRVINFKMPL